MVEDRVVILLESVRLDAEVLALLLLLVVILYDVLIVILLKGLMVTQLENPKQQREDLQVTIGRITDHLHRQGAPVLLDHLGLGQVQVHQEVVVEDVIINN